MTPHAIYGLLGLGSLTGAALVVIGLGAKWIPRAMSAAEDGRHSPALLWLAAAVLLTAILKDQAWAAPNNGWEHRPILCHEHCGWTYYDIIMIGVLRVLVVAAAALACVYGVGVLWRIGSWWLYHRPSAPQSNTAWEDVNAWLEGLEAAARTEPDPTTLVATPADALHIADAMLLHTPSNGVFSDSAWPTVSHGALAAILYAASPRGNGKGIRWASTAASTPDADKVSPGWVSATYCVMSQPLLRNALRHVLDMDSRQRDSIARTMRAALAPWVPSEARNE